MKCFQPITIFNSSKKKYTVKNMSTTAVKKRRNSIYTTFQSNEKINPSSIEFVRYSSFHSIFDKKINFNIK